MLPKFFQSTDGVRDVSIRKFTGELDVSDSGAFEYGSLIDTELAIPCRLGVRGAVVRIARDGEEYHDMPFEFRGSDGSHDLYSCTLDTAKLCCGEESGLFYYSYLLLRGEHTLFSDTQNNKDCTFSESAGGSFRLLVYEKGFKAPDGFGRGVMYQIFPDRFYRGSVECPMREGAIREPDWDGGIPPYPPVAGGLLENNVFFGGTLWGVAEKLDYLKSLGVTYIYLCPIFKAYSNHRYDTGDYSEVDPMLGGEEAFKSLIEKARELGIGIILDGVFNHTGVDSLYFDKYGRYGQEGAYSSKESPYYGWYNFRSYPDEYESWWGVPILPRLDHSNEACRRFFTGEGGIVEKYVKMGIAGWRLDVADELSDTFLDELRVSAKRESRGSAVIIGEVWENAADKTAYGKRRRYLLGSQLDSVMNYPLRNAVISFCRYADGETLYNTLTEIYSSYPRTVSDSLMNLLGTHDTERILTALGRDEDDGDAPPPILAHKRLDADQRTRAVRLLKIASVLQYTVYGIPSLYYGDETALEGYGDPFCRMPMPWSFLDEPQRADVLEHYRALGRIRLERAFDGGRFCILEHGDSHIVFTRESGDCRILIAANMGESVFIDTAEGTEYLDLFSSERYSGRIRIEGENARVFKIL